jgi:LPXTG-motif cell wall-anchored protein
VRVPGEGESAPFFLILGGMTVILIGLIAYFRRRGWL